MQTRLNFYPSGLEPMKAMTRLEQQITRSGLKPRFTTSSFISRLACSAILFISTVLLSPVLAAAPLAAGFETLQAADGADKPLEVAVWYPTEAMAQVVDIGPFTLNIARGGAVAGQSLPLIVISHGNGGASLSHHDTAVAFAQAGYVVAEPPRVAWRLIGLSQATTVVDRPASCR